MNVFQVRPSVYPAQCGEFLSMHVICNFTSRKMENVNTALFRGCLSLPAQKDRHHYDNNEPIFKEKQYMWYKVRELQSKGLNKTQIGKHLGVDRSTVRRYLQMSREDFVRRRNSHRKYTLKLAGYEEYVRGTLEEYPYISAARIHDWLKECYPDFPEVCDKTVFNFVEKVRCKYGIGKKSEARIRRDYEKLPDTPYGEYAQADFGEKWMSAGNGRSTKVYFLRSSWHVHVTSSPFSPAALSTRNSPSMHMSVLLSISEGNRKRSFMTRTGC